MALGFGGLSPDILVSMDPFDLDRFVAAQRAAYEPAKAELEGGRKHGHWIWFVFPQLKGLGISSMSNRFGIGSAEEASAYLAHPVLGMRLRECVSILNRTEGKSAEQILGGIDAMKVRSCLTLFASVAPGDVFDGALAKFYGGEPDTMTLDILQRQNDGH